MSVAALIDREKYRFLVVSFFNGIGIDRLKMGMLEFLMALVQ